MKRITHSLLLLLLLTIIKERAHSQNWQLVWSDEFTNGIGPDWVFETGNGSGGWGNNERQYYRRENATAVNGELVITARRENIGGFAYTSARMKTQGRRSWKYGKIAARIKMPAFSGIWPAFWMLGDNITQVSWPACGEIDIMEHINAEQRSYGTIHWRDHNNQYAQYGGNTGVNVTGYHEYAITWDAHFIRWFVDGVQFHEANIANGINGTSEFHANQFIILNMAVGGNWPGFNIDNNGFPATMHVDWVRVWQDGGGNTNPQPVSIQAENYNSMAGVQTEACTDAGGGQNVGWIDATDWMAFYNINFPVTGTYRVEYRVASLNGGGRVSCDLNAGSIQLGAVDIPATGGWQNWTTISHTVNVNAGTYNLGVFAAAGGWNLNWVRITPLTGARALVENLITQSITREIPFSIAPNPVVNQLTIATTEDITGGIIRIYDISGKEVVAARPAAKLVDVTALAKGVYTLVFTKNEKQITKQFIK